MVDNISCKKSILYLRSLPFISGFERFVFLIFLTPAGMYDQCLEHSARQPNMELIIHPTIQHRIQTLDPPRIKMVKQLTKSAWGNN